jgi:peptidoglycan/LPS O-acetylase OafA/YrhL
MTKALRVPDYLGHIAKRGLPVAINSSSPALLLLPALAATLLSSALLFLVVERPLLLKRSITTGP